MTVSYIIPGLPTVEINGTVKEVKYTQFMQGITKVESKSKALYNNDKRSTRIIHIIGEEIDNMHFTCSFKPSWILKLSKPFLSKYLVSMKLTFLEELS